MMRRRPNASAQLVSALVDDDIVGEGFHELIFFLDGTPLPQGRVEERWMILVGWEREGNT